MDTLAKAELHVHLEGAASPQIIKKIAQRNQITLQQNLFTTDGQGFAWKDFLHFLDVYEAASQVIKQPRDYYDITFDYLQQTAQQGAIYVEMMYSPEHAERSSGIPSQEHLFAIQQAIDDAEDKYAIVGRILVTAARHYGVEAAIKVAKHANERPVDCVVGYGMGGDEQGYPANLFKQAYQIAHDAGLGCTVHAGEIVGAQSVIDALDHLPVSRLGHGVRAIESPEAMARIKDQGIVLEVCPGSNIALGLYPDITSHPLPTLMEQGIICTLSSDDPPYFHTSLGNEYEMAKNIMGLDDVELLRLTRNSIEAAFVSDDVKQALLRRLS